MTGNRDERKKNPRHQKTGLWVLDASAFQPPPRTSFYRRRILTPVRSLGKYTLYVLAFSYPVLLVSLGLVFGGIVFWTSLVGSIALMWLIIRKTGYARNFAGWGVGGWRLLGLFGAFGIALAFFYGLTHLGDWFFPVFMAVLVTSFVTGLAIHSRE